MKKRISTWLAVLAGLAAMSTIFSSCGFSPKQIFFSICGWDKTPLTPVTGDFPKRVFEESGTIKVMHGTGSASSPNGSEFPFRVEQQDPLPAYADQALVFLNGWRLTYKGSDQHVLAIGTVIARVKVKPGSITWDAGGLLRDDDGHEAFIWTYTYTIIAWNSQKLRLFVDQTDAEDQCSSQQPSGNDNLFAAQNTDPELAVANFPSFLENPGFSGTRAAAVLPRGIGFNYNGSDHHLLQLAWNLHSAAPFARDQDYNKGVEQLLNPLSGTGKKIACQDFISWQTTAIMKDDSSTQDFEYSELVSGLTGADLEVIQPEFKLTPASTAGAVQGSSGIRGEKVHIDSLPYLVAIPVLTGWDIGYVGGDNHVKDIGVWIDDFSYARPANASTGTLDYVVSSILKDNDQFPPNYFRHKVTILGLKPIDAAVPGAPKDHGIPGVPKPDQTPTAGASPEGLK